MKVLGIETSCDDTGVAVYDTASGLRAHRVRSQVLLHDEYGGVVPELASRDHIRWLLPLLRSVVADAGLAIGELDAVAYTEGPGLAGSLLVGASLAASLAMGLGVPALGIHHLEGHLLSPLLSANPPTFPFVALLVSGGHTQLMRVTRPGHYELLGETLDDAAGEAFDKTAKLLGLGYPGGPQLAKLAEHGAPSGKNAFVFPRPMLSQLEKTGDLDFSFSGLKTAVVLACRQRESLGQLDDKARADIAAEFQRAVVDVLVAKSIAALDANSLDTLVVAGGVGANRALRDALGNAASLSDFRVYYPEIALCTDNGAMIAFAAAQRLSGKRSGRKPGDGAYTFTVRPRWDLARTT